MKKTFSLSISGRIFQVEEDAYALLLDYLESLSQVFKGEDGQEIVNDIETRISEIFQERLEAGKIVYTIADAEEVIGIIGNAEQIAISTEQEEFQIEQNATVLNNKAATPPPPFIQPTVGLTHKRKLYRSDTDKVLGGVLAGIATRFGVNVLPLRIITVLLVFPLGFVPIFLIYCVAWAIVPLADTPERRLEQEGKPVTVANIGEVLSNQSSQATSKSNAQTVLHTLGALCMGFVGLMSGLLSIGLLIVILVLLSCMVAVICGADIPLNILSDDGLISLYSSFEVIMAFLTAICICIAVLLPCIALVWAACNVLFKVKGASSTLWITALIIEAIAIIIPCIMIPFVLSN